MTSCTETSEGFGRGRGPGGKTGGQGVSYVYIVVGIWARNDCIELLDLSTTEGKAA